MRSNTVTVTGHGHASGTVPAVRISLLVLKPFSASSKQHKEQQEQACDSVVLKRVNLRTVTVTVTRAKQHGHGHGSRKDI